MVTTETPSRGRAGLNRRILVVAGLGAAVTLFGGLLPTAAAPTPSSAIREVAPQSLDERVVLTREGDTSVNLVERSLNEVDVTVPDDLSQSIALHDATGRTADVGIRLPQAARQQRLQVDAAGVATIDHRNSSATSPIVKEDGSVQIVTVLSGPDAPSTYSYELILPAGGRAEIVDGSWVAILDAQGAFAGGIAPAWAEDAAGQDVPTRYTLEGTTLTQHVDHADVTYPVVADPWLGKNLFYSVGRDTYNGQPRYNLRKSAWGTAVHAPTAAGAAIMLNQGWAEATSRQPGLKAKRTLIQQYQCHVGGAVYGIGGVWNLEQFRPTRTVTWVKGVGTHRCNWKTATYH